MTLDDTVLAATFATIGPRATIRPGSFDATLAASTGPLGAELAPVAPRLVLGSTIGEGGMAVVRSANQTSLGREVAVKTLRSDATDEARPRLLREAWITGALEHPNIVPVHDLGADERGRPMIVLKRIEGRPWSDLLDKPAELRARFGTDALEWNLQQLVHVCHAIAYAHSKGIVHRDLKPSNVMIGGFGEVYVLDWGIAVSLVDDGTGRLPLAADCTELAGTLAYMAPEMLGGGVLTARTDVYLLGAILCEIVTGSPPHLCESVTATLESIRRSSPALSPDAPDELAAIIRRAMARDPAARHASAEELRGAIVGFLEHRGSAQIAQEASARLAELAACLAGPAVDRVVAYQLFAQCRFGFQAALRAWPANDAARAGLDQALAAMASYELDQGDTRAASVFVAELTVPQPELAARLARAEEEAARKARRLEQLEVDQDTSRGGFVRIVFLALLGLVWSGLPLAANYFPVVDIDHRTSLIAASTVIVAIVVFAVVARDTMLKTAVNRGVLLTVLMGMGLHALLETLTWALGIDMVTTHIIAIAQWAGVTGIAAIFLERVLLLPTLGFLVAMVATVLSPATRFWSIAAGAAVLLGVVIYIWHRGGRGREMYGLVESLRRVHDERGR